MARIIAKGPDGRTHFTSELEGSRAVLLGRAPNPETVSHLGLEAAQVDLAPVSAPSVSANHAVVWNVGGSIYVRDLESRNGSWLLLPPGHTVQVGTADVVLQLAHEPQTSAADDEPHPPSWSDAHDFPVALARTIEPWLRSHGVEARVSVSVRSGDTPEAPTFLPVPTGKAVCIVPVNTADASWSRLLEQLWRWLARQNAIFEAEEETRGEGMVLKSRAIREAHRDVVDAARSSGRTLLLTGPSGSGKEMLAEVFHRHSAASGPFVPVNCAMFSKELLRSELFGAEPGSFTGATRRIVGAVERAQGGTLFLDEIGEIPLDVQPMLLRFLDRREYESMGQYGRVRRADVRVVAATNRDLRERTRAGHFRDDLWYRLSVHVVEVPALTDRWDDVVAYLESVPLLSGRHSMREALTEGAMDLLRSHGWEGNFRELTNFAQRLPRDAEPGSIDSATCARALERGALRRGHKPTPVSESPRADWAELVTQAIQGFVEDHGYEPGTWDDQKEWNEKYLKPLLFFRMCGAPALKPPVDDGAIAAVVPQAATRVSADRGTAAKQLARYFERFGYYP